MRGSNYSVYISNGNLQEILDSCTSSSEELFTIIGILEQDIVVALFKPNAVN